MPITVYRGIPSQLQGHWLARVQSLTPNTRAASRVIVPTGRLQHALEPLVPGAPAIVPLDAWLAQALPQHITCIPWGTWEFLADLVPDALLPTPWRHTPGVREALASVVARGRDMGVRAIAHAGEGRLDWSALWAWFEERLPLTVADRLRLYEYAHDAADVLIPPEGILMIYGFVSWPGPWLELLAHYGQERAIELWALRHPRSVSSLKTGFRRAAVHWVDVGDAERGYNTVRGYGLGTDGDALDQASQCLALMPDGPSLTTVVLAEPEEERAFLRALWRHGLVFEEAITRPRDPMLWRLFWSVAQGRASRAACAHWCSETGFPTDQWAKDWWAQVQHLSRWNQLAPLIVEAETRHGASWSLLVDWAERIGAWDDVGGPSPERILSALTAVTRAWELTTPPAWPVLSIDEAIWRPSPRVMFIAPRPRARPETPFDRDGPIRRSIHETDSAPPDSWLLREILEDPGVERWVVGDSPWVRQLDGIRWMTPPDVVRDRVAPAAPLVHGWYRAWREDDRYSSYTGQIAPAWVAVLMPRALSPSAVEDFGRCPLRFLLGRLMRVPEASRDGPEVDPGLVGEWAHRALEILVKRGWTPSAETVDAAVAEALASRPAPAGVNPLQVLYQRDRLASELLEALLRDDGASAVKSEVEIALTWHWLWPMNGRVDRLDWLPDGSLRLVDYKTGRIENPLLPHPGNLQLLIYQAVIADRYQRPVQAELYGISQRSGFQHRHVPSDAEPSVRQIVDRMLRAMKRRIDKGQFYPVPMARLDPCRGCDFRLICPSRVSEYAERKIAAHPDYARLWTKAAGEEDDIGDNDRGGC
ncbi:MAG: PD-(D/E)XK nuclease family protein [Firmicutes bacterium]|nr:PD-(D/E)XK nuclease family protein [Bacillota bacterium]